MQFDRGVHGRVRISFDTSKGGGMIPVDQQQGCFCFRKHRGP